MHKNCLAYPVEFAKDAFGESDALAKMLIGGREGPAAPRVFIVADQNVVQRTEGLGTKIGRYVRTHGIELAGSPVIVAGGEKSKLDDMQSVLMVASEMLRAGLGCRDVVLAIGGGSVLDVAGWASSQACGGVPLVRMPTTPEAMLDAAFAEYAAVDSPDVKDALRVKSVPAGVVVDTTFASTVLDGVWRGGIGEAVRLALARDASFFKELVAQAPAYRGRDADSLDKIVSGALAVRSKKGGSTFALWSALRLQSMSGWKLPHGYAVAIGVLIEVACAAVAGGVSESVRDTVVGFFGECGTLDGLVHSQYLLQHTDRLLAGIDEWLRTSPGGTMEVLSGVGKAKATDAPDLELYREALKYLGSVAGSRFGSPPAARNVV